MENLMEMARSVVSGETLGRISAQLRENPEATRMGLDEAVPVSVAGLADQASTEAGAGELLESFRRGDYPQVEADDLGRAMEAPGAVDRVVQSSEGFLARAFGPRLGGVIEQLSRTTGLSRGSASKLLGLAAPLVTGLVGKLAMGRQLDARGLSGFLGEQKRLAAGLLPGPLAGLLGMTPAMAAVPGPARVVGMPVGDERRSRSILPWLLGGLAILAGLWWMANRGTRHQAAVRSAAVSHPAATEPTAAQPEEFPAARNLAYLSSETGMAPFSSAIESDAPLPRHFVAQGLEFRTDTADIDVRSVKVLDDLAGALTAHPSARIRVEGHTDSTGNADVNDRLSVARAEAVKSYRVQRGVGADRVESSGAGSTSPVASNATADGRARNRRTEVILVER